MWSLKVADRRLREKSKEEISDVVKPHKRRRGQRGQDEVMVKSLKQKTEVQDKTTPFIFCYTSLGHLCRVAP